MKRKIFFFIILFVFLISTFSIMAEPRIEFDLLINKNQSAELFSSRTFLGSGRESVTFSDYRVEIFDQLKSKIQKIFVPVTFLVLDPTEDVEQIPVTVNLPYSTDFKELKVFNNDKLLLEEDLSYLCNENDVCDLTENSVSCPDDCPSGSQDLFCDRIEDDICDPDCLLGDVDCDKDGKSTLPLIFIGSFLLVGAVILIWIYWRRSNSNSQ